MGTGSYVVSPWLCLFFLLVSGYILTFYRPNKLYSLTNNSNTLQKAIPYHKLISVNLYWHSIVTLGSPFACMVWKMYADVYQLLMASHRTVSLLSNVLILHLHILPRFCKPWKPANNSVFPYLCFFAECQKVWITHCAFSRLAHLTWLYICF